MARQHVHRRQPGEGEEEEHQPDGPERDPECQKPEPMQIAEKPCVRIVEIAVRHLAGHHALRDLREHPVVVRNPAVIGELPEIDRRQAQESGEYSSVGSHE